MEKLIYMGGCLDYKLSGDTIENITLENVPGRRGMRDIIVAEEDGIVITKNGNVPYKKGQIVASFYDYGSGDFDTDRVIVFTSQDLLDILAYQDELNAHIQKEINNKENETV